MEYRFSVPVHLAVSVPADSLEEALAKMNASLVESGVKNGEGVDLAVEVQGNAYNAHVLMDRPVTGRDRFVTRIIDGEDVPF